MGDTYTYLNGAYFRHQSADYAHGSGYVAVSAVAVAEEVEGEAEKAG